MRIRTSRPGEAFEVAIRDDRIVALTPIPAESSFDLLLPGFFDIQVNGALGHDFTSNELNTGNVREVVDWCRSRGTVQFLATVITASRETLASSFHSLVHARNHDRRILETIVGFHLEGPYLSGDDGPRGAHPREHVRDPDEEEFRRLQDAAEGHIKLITLAPERPGAIRFIEQLTKAGVLVAIGHTNATAAQINDAVLAGATLSTHLGNGCHATLPRHDNVIWNQLADDRLTASLIADGHHLPNTILKSMLRAKGIDRLILTADTGPLAGLPPGVYPSWGQSFEVLPSGKIVVPGTPYLAGSGVALRDCVRYLLIQGLASDFDLERLACLNPRRLFGLPVPALSIGSIGSDWVIIPSC